MELQASEQQAPYLKLDSIKGVFLWILRNF